MTRILGVIGFLLLTTMLACQPPEPAGTVEGEGAESPQDSTEGLRSALDAYVEVWNTGNTDLLAQAVDASVVRESPGQGFRLSATGIEELGQAITEFRTAFPDTRVTIDSFVAGGGQGVAQWTFSGTNSGPGPFEPTGNSATVEGVSVYTFSGGKISEEQVYFDNLDFMTQLGFTLQPPGEGGN